MDIEEGEFDWVESMTKESLLSIKQLCMEIHGRTHLFMRSLDLMKKLSETHYLVHVHPNNWANRTVIVNGVAIPEVIETTLLRKDCFLEPPKLNTRKFPKAGLDCKNHARFDDINMNFPPFVNV